MREKEKEKRKEGEEKRRKEKRREEKRRDEKRGARERDREREGGRSRRKEGEGQPWRVRAPFLWQVRREETFPEFAVCAPEMFFDQPRVGPANLLVGASGWWMQGLRPKPARGQGL